MAGRNTLQLPVAGLSSDPFYWLARARVAQSTGAGDTTVDRPSKASERKNPIWVVNSETRQPYNDAQEGAYGTMIQSGDLDRLAPVGSHGFPRGMPDADAKPAPGEWYVDLDGRLKQAPGDAVKTEAAPASISPGRRYMLDALSSAEGTDEDAARRNGYASGYEVLGHYRRSERPLTSMTLDEVMQLQQRIGGPMGRYQAMHKTLNDFRKARGLTGKELFDASLQDQFGVFAMERRGYDKAGLSDEDLQRNLSREWASIADPDNSVPYYPNQHLGMDTQNFRRTLATARVLDARR